MMYHHSPLQVHALRTLFERYRRLIEANAERLAALPARCQAPGLGALCEQAIAHHERYPFDKLNRWLGFVQGVLAVTGLIDVDEEREFSRPLLHAFHSQTPPSFES